MELLKCLSYIEKNLETQLTVKQIAEYMAYSEAYFSRTFRKQMGISVMDYIIGRKLVKAAEMLVSGQKVLDTALQFGWQSHSGFTKAFWRKFGFSPSLLKMMVLQINDIGGYVFMEKTVNFLSKEQLWDILKKNTGKNLEKFYQMACEAYGEMKRYSGEEFVTHPLNVAIILAQMEAAEAVIWAGLFHDVFSLQQEKQDMLMEQLPGEVQKILRVFSKVDVKQYSWNEQEEAAVMVKLADRLHNMRTLNFLEEKRWSEKARETIEIYMPVARRLGNQKLLEELNDLALAYLE